jgi:magnesium transporter
MPMHFNVVSSILKPFERISLPGAVPGTVIAAPEEPSPVIRIMAFSDGDLIDETVETLDGIKELTEHHNVTWVNVAGLGDADVIHQFGEMFDLHRLSLEDVVNVHQRPKVEDYGHYLFVIARMVGSTDQLETEQIAFFVGPSFVLTFQEGRSDICLDPVRDRIRLDSGRIRHRGSDYLVYALLDSIVDHYFPVVEGYGERLDQMDVELTATRGDASIGAIQRFRSELLILRRAVRPHREAINALLRDDHDCIGEETRIYLRDCYDHTIQLGDAIDTYREVCSDLRDFHMAAIGYRTNEATKTLTIIATIFIPLSFIAGLYGMNFHFMPELQWKYGYPVVLGLMLTVASSLLFWFRNKGWFRE